MRSGLAAPRLALFGLSVVFAASVGVLIVTGAAATIVLVTAAAVVVGIALAPRALVLVAVVVVIVVGCRRGHIVLQDAQLEVLLLRGLFFHGIARLGGVEHLHTHTHSRANTRSPCGVRRM